MSSHLSERTEPDAGRQQLQQIRELKRRRQLGALSLEVAQQEQQLQALHVAGFGRQLPGRNAGGRPSATRPTARRESAQATEDFFDADALFVNAADYIGESGYGYGSAQSPWLSTRSDRADGRNRPMFATETELAAIRGAARLLANYNPNAVGILEHLTNYAIGEGFSYKFAMLEAAHADQTLAKLCQRVVDRFLEANDFVGDMDGELFLRSRRDGEYFYGLWHLGHGHVEGRAIEPEQITEPAAPAVIEDYLDRSGGLDDWSFGVHADGDDTENAHGVYAQWSNNAQDWSYLPAGRHPCSPPGPDQNAWVEHCKINVDRKIKRGLSDFFCAQVMLEAARKLLRNMGSGASIQAAIAWIVETAAGTLPATVTSLSSSQSAGPYYQPTQQGSRVNQTQKYDPGTVLYTPNGSKYHPAPLGSDNAPNFVLVYEAMMRSLAVRWQMPEHMVTGSAANNDYASILEAGSPFEKAMRRKQVFYGRSHARILWKVLEFACAAGVIPCDFATLRAKVRLAVKPPRVAVRNRLEDVQADNLLYAAGAMSSATMAANDGLDYQEEQDQGAQPHIAKGKAAETPVDAHAAAAQQASALEAAVVLESGGGNPNHDNKGEFASSSGGGAGGARPKARAPSHAQTKTPAAAAEKKPTGGQPKPAGVKPSGQSKAKVEAFGREEQEIDKMTQKGYGFDLQNVASVVGAPDNATVEVKASSLPGNDVQLRVAIKHPAIDQCRRTLSVDGEGHKFIHNDILVLKDEYQKSGAGSDIFSREVEQAQKAGFSYIETHAAKEGGFNGYYTWPRLGYDQDLETMDRGVAAAAQRKFPGAKSVLDVMSTKEGREWWKQHGDDMTEARFDLAPGSRSLKIHAAYMAERAKAQAA